MVTSNRAETRAGRLAAAIVGGLFLAAAFGKAWDAREGTRFLWLLARDLLGIEFSAPVLGWMLLGLVIVEAGLGAYLILASPAAVMAWGAAGLLAIFSAAHVWAIFRDAPACGCLGIRAGGEQEAWLGLGRNAAAVYLLAWSAWPGGADRSSPQSGSFSMATARSRTGFTIVEMMVTVVVIAVLGAILAPALQGAREQSRATGSLRLNRQVVAAMSAYAEDFRGGFPFMATPGDPLEPLRVDGQVIPGNFLSGQSRRWLTLCCPGYIEPREAIESARAREVDMELDLPERLVRSHFFATETLFARPQYWYGAEEPTYRAEHFQGTHLWDVMFPSQKGMVVDIRFGLGTDEPPAAGDYLLTAFGDGSADRLEASLPSNGAVLRGHGSLGWPVLSTRNGLHGRDR